MRQAVEQESDEALAVYLRTCNAAREKRRAGKISGWEYQELCRRARAAYSAAVRKRRALAGER